MFDWFDWWSMFDNFNLVIASFLAGKTVVKKCQGQILITSELRSIFQEIWNEFDDQTIKCLSAVSNRNHNRYLNVLPYDFNRVKLTSTARTRNAKFCDYINASHVKHVFVPRRYIMCQGPLETTCYSFWKMIIEQNVKMVVMLGNFVEQNRSKVFQYLPIDCESSKSTQFGNVIIRCSEIEEIGKIYVKRRLHVENIDSGDSYGVNHFHFVSWSDFGVPSKVEHLETLLNDTNYCYKSEEDPKKGPIVVHCSAGVGRSGVFVYVDILLSLLSESSLDSIDYVGELISIRKQRMKCIQTFPQFMYALQVVKLMYPKIANWGSVSPVKPDSLVERIDENAIVDTQVLLTASEVKRRRFKSISHVDDSEEASCSFSTNNEDFETLGTKPPPCPARTTSLMVTSVEYETLESLPIQQETRPELGFSTPDVQASKAKRPFFNLTKTDSRLLLRQKLGNKRKIATNLRKSLTSKFRKLEKNLESSFVDCENEEPKKTRGVEKKETGDDSNIVDWICYLNVDNISSNRMWDFNL